MGKDNVGVPLEYSYPGAGWGDSLMKSTGVFAGTDQSGRSAQALLTR